MNSSQTIEIIRFFVLLLAQVLLFSHINFLGFINPYLYILFVVLFPVKNNRIVFLFVSFLLGLSVDMFLDSGGIHAAALTTIAFVRPFVLKYSFGALYDYQSIKFSKVDLSQFLTYIIILTLIHHFVLFSLDYFTFSSIFLVLKSTLFSGIFTILLCMMITILFSRTSPK